MFSTKIASLALAFLLLLQIAIAQPHGKRHNKRDDSTYTTVTVVVYVDQYGNTIQGYQPQTTTTTTTPVPTPKVTTTTTTTPVAAEVTPIPEVTTTAQPSTTAVPNIDTSGSVNKGVATPSGLSKPAIVYSPYQDNGDCKSKEAIASDINSLSATFGMVRLYGTDCHQVEYTLAAARPLGVKVFVGIYEIATCTAQLAALNDTIVKQFNGDWSSIYAVAVGNELVNSGQMGAAAVVEKINTSRDYLRECGYTGPVVTADTWVAIIANPILCQASDFVAANCHPFFDGNVLPGATGQFMIDSIAKVKAACGGKQTMITEVGWPHQGNPIGVGKPGLTEQNEAIVSIYGAIGNDAVYFTWTDDNWKKDNAATANAEKYWGIKNLAAFA